jgi:hypothetical protein
MTKGELIMALEPFTDDVPILLGQEDSGSRLAFTEINYVYEADESGPLRAYVALIPGVY